MLLALMTLLVGVQVPAPGDPPPPPKQEQTPANPDKADKHEPAPKPVAAWEDSEAKAAVATFTKAMAGAGSMADKLQALAPLALGSNHLLVKPLVGVVTTDKSVVVRKRAGELLANQPTHDATGAILHLLGDRHVQACPPVMAVLVQGLGKLGYQSKNWGMLEPLFEGSYAAENVSLQQAILELVTAKKEKQAAELLLRNLDEPVPKDVNAAPNPPKEYWEARWKAWKVWRDKVREALFAITGQRFSTAAEARLWLHKNGFK
jgi:hypothetical protein